MSTTEDIEVGGEDKLTAPQPLLTSTPKQLLRHKRVASLQGGTPVLKIPASPLLHRLGYGSGVDVYVMERSPKPSGELRSPWAIKKVQKARRASCTSKAIFAGRLEYEAEVLRRLSHPNIVEFKAVLKSADGGASALAMEKASRSLGELIAERMEGDISMICRTSADVDGLYPLDPFPPRQIAKVALDISKALEYLHGEVKMIHGDVKSANVLIFGDFETAKLCDFGVSRKIKEDGTIEGEYAGTEWWSPMEVILTRDGDKKYNVTSKADIYPFGLTVFEMISLQPPNLPTLDESMEDDSDFDDSFFDKALVESVGKRPPLPDIDFDESYNEILALFYCCTEEDPEARPAASDIVKLLSLP